MLLVLLNPALALVCLAVALESRGPPLFCHMRTSQHGRIFPILKFHSMHVMEDGADVRLLSEQDVCVTRVGRIIPKLALDELVRRLVAKTRISLSDVAGDHRAPENPGIALVVTARRRHPRGEPESQGHPAAKLCRAAGKRCAGRTLQ